MTDWIDINLPWRNNMSNDDLPALDDDLLDQRAIAELGMTIDQSSSTVSEELEDEYMSVGWDPVDREEALSLEKFAPIKKHQAFVAKYSVWHSKQPEVIEWNKRIDEIRAKHDLGSFCGLELNKPGTLIEIEKAGVIRHLLIGNINTESGVCDDCRAFDNETIVKRYRVVWDSSA